MKSKLVTLSMIEAVGLEVFENWDDFNTWLQSDVANLDFQQPGALLDSCEGRWKVLNVLNTLLHEIHL